MIARRIFAALLFALCFLLLELHQNTGWGWALTAMIVIGFALLFECGVVRGKPLMGTMTWLGAVLLFATVFFLTSPPVRRVPALAGKGAKETAVVTLADGKVRGVIDEENGVEIYAGVECGSAVTVEDIEDSNK